MNADLIEEQKMAVKALIRDHANNFAWKPADIPGIDPQVMAHQLNVRPDARPIR